MNKLPALILSIPVGVVALLAFWTASPETQEKITSSSSWLIGFLIAQAVIIMLYPLIGKYTDKHPETPYRGVILRCVGIVLVGFLIGAFAFWATSTVYQSMIEVGTRISSTP